MKLRVPARFKEATLASLDTMMAKPIVAYLERYESNARRGMGLLLSGPPGVGKTWAIVALTGAVVELYAEKGKWFDYEFVTAPNMFDRMPAIAGKDESLDTRRGQSWTTTFLTVPWLVLNDLSKEYRGGALHEQVTYKLGRVLRERSEKRLVTHITTNLVLKGEGSLSSVYGESISSLLSETVKSYALNGADKRRR